MLLLLRAVLQSTAYIAMVLFSKKGWHKMTETSQHTLSLTKEDLSLVILGLGELPTKHTYTLVKKLEALLPAPTPNENT